MTHLAEMGPQLVIAGLIGAFILKQQLCITKLVTQLDTQVFPLPIRPQNKPRGRVALFIDMPNVWHAVTKRHLILLYEQLLEAVAEDATSLNGAFLFFQLKERNTQFLEFLDIMRSKGFIVVMREVNEAYLDTQDSDVDSLMVTHMLSRAASYDTAVVVSGDSGFLPAYEALRAWHRRVEVWSFPECTARRVINYADSFVDISEPGRGICVSRGR